MSRGADVARVSYLAFALCAACGGPPVDARAVWIDVREQADGSRLLHVYDRGQEEELPLLLPEGLALLRAQLGPVGRGLLIRGGNRDATYVDLGDARHLPLRLTPPPNQSSDTVSFTVSGDALHWREADELFVVPLDPGVELERSTDGEWLEPLRADLTGAGWVASAATSPVLLARDPVSKQATGPLYGQVAAYRFLDPVGQEPALRELGRGDIDVPGLIRLQQCPLTAIGCGSNWAFSPDGESATFAEPSATPGVNPGDANCRFLHWRWREGPELTCLALPEELDEVPEAITLLAAIDRDVLVVHDQLRLHRWDIRTDEVDSVPIAGLAPYAWRITRDGKAVIFVSLSGPVARVDLEGAELVTTTQTSCSPGPGSGGLELSPDGRWAVWACRPPEDGATFEQSGVVRVSPGGLERFDGIPMVVLAIDDGGDVLLYSAETGGGEDPEGVAPDLEPLSLWTLSADAVLRRIDQLEPTPEPVLLLSGDQTTFIQAAAIR